MPNATFNIPLPVNEPILPYAPSSPEKESVVAEIKRMRSQEMDIPMIINGKEVRTDDRHKLTPPYDHQHVLGYYHQGNKSHVEAAIKAAKDAKASWQSMSWYTRAAIFLKAAELISGPRRSEINAATILAQSKNVYQAEIDAVAEFADFLRFNAYFAEEIYSIQPESSDGIWNSLEYRPLEGFIFAITPFNFTAIAGNLPCAPAMMGNTVVWKPADSQIYSAHVVMDILREAGLPDGVINLVYVDGPEAGEVVFNDPDFGGLHFTGSTGVFQHLWKTIGTNISNYKSYPRIVGETGGKDFVVAHPTANADQVAVALLRGSFEFQGQKCSAASRAYIPASLWPAVKERLVRETNELKVGSPEDFSNFVNAVIDEKSFDKIVAYIEDVKSNSGATIIAGGTYDKSAGYFIDPTIIQVEDPKYRTMCEEIFGPVLSIYVYEDDQFSEILEVVDSTSPYALTGSIFSGDRAAIIEATDKLSNAAGNFYINDKPTGAVVGQQPFGGARGSGTNDKAGSVLNLLRWVSPRTIKETLNPPKDYKYPFLG